MTAEIKYVPMSDANTERLKTSLKLPYSLEQNVGINVGTTLNLCQLAGINTIAIHNDNSRSSPAIVGITPSGTAMAGFTRSETIGQINSRRNQANNRPCSTWSHLEIRVNEESAVAQLEQQKKDLRDPSNWAHIIDGCIKDSIVAGGHQNLVKRCAEDNAMGVFVIGNFMAFLSVDATNYAIMFAGSFELIDKVAHIIKFGKERPGRGSRWSISFFGAPELDRALILNLATPFTRLAKKIK